MRGLGLFLIFFLLSGCKVQENYDWQTYCEKSFFRKTPRYKETIAYCKQLAEYSPYVEYRPFGISPQGRELPLLILDKRKEFSSVDLYGRKRPVVLFQACIHAGECEGKDAGLMLLRDIVINGKWSTLQDSIVLLFIPIFNVDGHERFGAYNRVNQNGPEEMGWRVTAMNLNLNRDFLKADCPEMQAWLHLFNEWLPDFLIDSHTTDGADHQYTVSYAVETHRNLVKPVREWINKIYLPLLNQRMENAGYPLLPYGWFRKRHDVRSGLVSGVWGPRYSTGYGTVQNRVFLLIETHMLKPYKQRVEATYEMVLNSLKIVAEKADSLIRANLEGDDETSKMVEGTEFALSYHVNLHDSTMIQFKGVSFNLEKSDISGGEWIRWGSQPVDYSIPYFSKVIEDKSVKIPYAYLIPPEWSVFAEKLRLHGVRVHRLDLPVRLNVELYRFKKVEWARQPFEGRHRVKFSADTLNEEVEYPAGSFVVFLNQRTNRLIVHLLEPGGDDSLLKWGFINGIFEQKEYIEDYVAEALARKMLKENPDLGKEFRKKLKSDAEFALNPRSRLQFFYKRSPYWDEKMNLYPVGRLLTKVELPLK